MEENTIDKPFNASSVNKIYYVYLATIPIGLLLSMWLAFFILIAAAITAKILQNKKLTAEQNSHYKHQVKTFWGYFVMSILGLVGLTASLYFLGQISIYGGRLSFEQISFAMMQLDSYLIILNISIFAYFVTRVIKGIKASNDEKFISGGIFSLGKIGD